MEKIKINKDISLDEVLNLSMPDAVTRYRIGKMSLLKIADECGAKIKVGSRTLYHRPTLDKYFNSKAGNNE